MWRWFAAGPVDQINDPEAEAVGGKAIAMEEQSAEAYNSAALAFRLCFKANVREVGRR